MAILTTAYVQCDLKPTCSRCARLKIPCIGSGERRYKFHTQLLSDRSHGTTPTPVAIRLAHNAIVLRKPENEQTSLIANFVQHVAFDRATDLRYSLTWAYGDFMLEIPRRLGTSPALDAAAETLLSCHARYISSQRLATPDEYSKYSRGLRALRNTLDDPVESRSPSTLCAVMLLMICQVGYRLFR